MNARVVIELDGSADEIEAWLRRLADGETASVTVPASPAEEPEQPYTPVVADQLVRRISPEARRAVRYIAENAPEVSWADVQRHLGRNGVQIGGVMASFGFAENAGIPRPYQNDRARRVYRMDPYVASAILDAVDRFEKRSGQTA